uniref:Uncharacterized protein n=1 Tax=Onchocerca volvulus TaxID=6282 RepID=A0A8R1XTC0_ONCVO
MGCELDKLDCMRHIKLCNILFCKECLLKLIEHQFYNKKERRGSQTRIQIRNLQKERYSTAQALKKGDWIG